MDQEKKREKEKVREKMEAKAKVMEVMAKAKAKAKESLVVEMANHVRIATELEMKAVKTQLENHLMGPMVKILQKLANQLILGLKNKSLMTLIRMEENTLINTWEMMCQRKCVKLW